MSETEYTFSESQKNAKKRDNLFRKIIPLVRDLFFPPRCVCCQTVIAAGEMICDSCRDEIEYHRVHKSSFYSGEEMAGAQFRAFDFDGLFAPFFYESPIKDGLLAMKFSSQRDNARFFALEIAKIIPEFCAETHFDSVCFVPLSENRLKDRGFDQSALMALYISQYTGIHFCKNALIKVYDAPAQHNEKFFRRFGNVFGAYEANKSEADGKTLLLIDDIATTGATLGECAKMLKLSGAEKVVCATAAISRKQTRKTASSPMLNTGTSYTSR